MAAREDTHFGEQTVPLAEKQGLVDGVFHSVARRYDLMNDLMSAGLHRAWKDALSHRGQPATKPSRPLSKMPDKLLPCSIWPAAPAMSRSAWPRPAAKIRASSVCDINEEMLSVGRERAAERGLDQAVSFEQGNAEELPYPDRSFDCVTIAFGIRNVPRIERALAEAYRVLKIGGRFLCLEFS